MRWKRYYVVTRVYKYINGSLARVNLILRKRNVARRRGKRLKKNNILVRNRQQLYYDCLRRRAADAHFA